MPYEKMHMCMCVCVQMCRYMYVHESEPVCTCICRRKSIGDWLQIYRHILEEHVEYCKQTCQRPVNVVELLIGCNDQLHKTVTPTSQGMCCFN